MVVSDVVVQQGLSGAWQYMRAVQLGSTEFSQGLQQKMHCSTDIIEGGGGGGFEGLAVQYNVSPEHHGLHGCGTRP